MSTPSMTPAILRTLVPFVYGLLIYIGAGKLGLDDAVLQEAASSVTLGILYVGLRLLERARSSKWGWLLGYPAAPVYPGAHAGPTKA